MVVQVYIDLEEAKSGDLFKSFEIVKERTIKVRNITDMACRRESSSLERR